MPSAAGVIDGDVRVSGHPKVQETFARVMGYCEQVRSTAAKRPAIREQTCGVNLFVLDV